jgi:hypothetical protein
MKSIKASYLRFDAASSAACALRPLLTTTRNQRACAINAHNDQESTCMRHKCSQRPGVIVQSLNVSINAHNDQQSMSNRQTLPHGWCMIAVNGCRHQHSTIDHIIGKKVEPRVNAAPTNRECAGAAKGIRARPTPCLCSSSAPHLEPCDPLHPRTANPP